MFINSSKLDSKCSTDPTRNCKIKIWEGEKGSDKESFLSCLSLSFIPPYPLLSLSFAALILPLSSSHFHCPDIHYIISFSFFLQHAMYICYILKSSTWKRKEHDGEKYEHFSQRNSAHEEKNIVMNCFLY